LQLKGNFLTSQGIVFGVETTTTLKGGSNYTFIYREKWIRLGGQ